MNRTITVKGIGKVSISPDLTVICMSLTTVNDKYGEAMANASEQIESVRSSLLSAGFEKNDLKTTNFDVRSHYESVKGPDGNYQSVFKGFEVNHSLKLEFGFDMKKLNEVLVALANCDARPRFSIEFSVKDKNAVSEALLVSAVENATEKAKILAKASNVKLGAIQNIEYGWKELRPVSNTVYRMEEKCLAARSPTTDIQPDNIDVSDTATLIWEIL